MESWMLLSFSCLLFFVTVTTLKSEGENTAAEVLKQMLMEVKDMENDVAEYIETFNDAKRDGRKIGKKVGGKVGPNDGPSDGTRDGTRKDGPKGDANDGADDGDKDYVIIKTGRCKYTTVGKKECKRIAGTKAASDFEEYQSKFPHGCYKFANNGKEWFFFNTHEGKECGVKGECYCLKAPKAIKWQDGTDGYGFGEVDAGKRFDTADDCARECETKKITCPRLNGVTYKPSNGKCWCELAMNLLVPNGNYKTAYILGKGPIYPLYPSEPVPGEDGCDWVKGQGGDAPKEVHLSYVSSRKQCAEKCQAEKKRFKDINGATVRRHDGKCWCQRGMTSKSAAERYDTCSLPTIPIVYDCNDCVFPFKHGGTTYEKCKASSIQGKYWCSTDVDEDGKHKEGKWQYCPDTCEDYVKIERKKKIGDLIVCDKDETHNTLEGLDGPSPTMKEACLTSANWYRARHINTGPLEWDDHLASEAQRWAEELGKRTRGNDWHAEHDPANNNPENQWGENIYMAKEHVHPGAESKWCTEANKDWYSEIFNYDFSKWGVKTTGGVVGHFTQMVWTQKPTGGTAKEKVGFGVHYHKTSEGYIVYLVAKYQPQGNIKGAEVSYVMERKDVYDDECIETSNAVIVKPREFREPK